MIAHYGCFKDVSAVIDMCPLCSALCAECFKLIVYLVANLCYGIKGATACPLFLTQKIAVMHWSEPKSYNKPFELLHSLDLALRANDPDIGTPFAKAGCLQQLSSLSASHSMSRS